MEKAISETQELSLSKDSFVAWLRHKRVFKFIHILKSSWNAIRPNDISLGMPETLFEFFI